MPKTVMCALYINRTLIGYQRECPARLDTKKCALRFTMHVMSCIFLFVRFATSVVYLPYPRDFHFSVVVLLLRMMVGVVYVVEYGVEYLMEYIVGYLASRWLLSAHAMVALWLLSG
jgi:hypothetical protein